MLQEPPLLPPSPGEPLHQEEPWWGRSLGSVPSAQHTPALPTGRQVLTASCGSCTQQRSPQGWSRPRPPLRELISCWMALEGSMSLTGAERDVAVATQSPAPHQTAQASAAGWGRSREVWGGAGQSEAGLQLINVLDKAARAHALSHGSLHPLLSNLLSHACDPAISNQAAWP